MYNIRLRVKIPVPFPFCLYCVSRRTAFGLWMALAAQLPDIQSYFLNLNFGLENVQESLAYGWGFCLQGLRHRASRDGARAAGGVLVTVPSLFHWGSWISFFPPSSFFFLNVILKKILYFYFIFLTLQYCIGFAIYQHESATGIHVFPILNPPPSSLPVPSHWVVPVYQPQASSIVHRTWTGSSFRICSLQFFMGPKVPTEGEMAEWHHRLDGHEYE